MRSRLLAGWARHREFWALLPVAGVLRLAGIGYGLPAVFNGDEPHVVNVAMSFGRGSLNPGIFKYPTLWMYVLFAAYGAGFLVWSGAGLLRSPEGFGELFVHQPGGFYLAGRLLAAAFSLAGLWWVYRTGRLAGGPAVGAWAAGLLAVSPALVESAHAAKPDCLFFFWSAWAWWLAAAYLRLGGRRRLVLAAAMVGLAGSTQYTAAPLAILVPCAWLARRFSGKADAGAATLAAALAAVPLAFLAGTPFALLDPQAFLRDLRDTLGAVTGSGGAGWLPLANLASFSWPWPLGAAALAAGAAWLARRRACVAACLVLPCAAAALFFSLQAAGGIVRYQYGVLPAAAVLTAAGLRAALSRARVPLSRPWGRAAALALVLLPGGLSSWAFDRELALPDTRSLASGWARENLPAGTRVLSDHEADSPRLPFSRDHARRLYRRTEADGHPRRHYYRLMVSGHPGGGYEVYQAAREAVELGSGPRHTRWSAAGRPVLDVRAGLAEARAAGVEVVVLTSHGLGRDADASYVRQTRAQGRLLAEFEPEPGRVRGPRIEIYRIGGGR